MKREQPFNFVPKVATKGLQSAVNEAFPAGQFVKTPVPDYDRQ
jgi:hypothetical protein